MWRHGWKDIPKVKIQEGLTHETANAIEVSFIAALGRRPTGLLVNLTDGGEGLINPTQEIRDKISRANAGTKRGPQSEECRRKISLANTGKIRTPEQCIKISVANKGRVRSEEFKAKVSATMKGRPTNNRNGAGVLGNAKIAAKLRGQKRSDASREKMRCSALNQSLEKREKIRLAVTAIWAERKRNGFRFPDSHGQKISDRLKGQPKSEIHTQRVREALLKRGERLRAARKAAAEPRDVRP